MPEIAAELPCRRPEPVASVSADLKVTETFASMSRGKCVIDPANATARQLSAAVLEAQAAPATREVQEAS
jgi:hypothetical protein